MPIIRPSDAPQLSDGAQRDSFNAALAALETRVNDALRAAVRFPVSVESSEDTRVREAIIARLVAAGWDAAPDYEFQPAKITILRILPTTVAT